MRFFLDPERNRNLILAQTIEGPPVLSGNLEMRGKARSTPSLESAATPKQGYGGHLKSCVREHAALLRMCRSLRMCAQLLGARFPVKPPAFFREGAGVRRKNKVMRHSIADRKSGEAEPKMWSSSQLRQEGNRCALETKCMLFEGRFYVDVRPSHCALHTIEVLTAPGASPQSEHPLNNEKELTPRMIDKNCFSRNVFV